MPIQIKRTSLVPESLRCAYLNSLAEPQEFYVESLVRTGQVQLILNGDTPIGYAVVNRTLVVEFYMVDSEAASVPAAFGGVLANSKATRVLCKTFDSLMLAAAASKPSKVKTTGHLFRKILSTDFVYDSQILMRSGTKEDIDLVLSIHDGFFDSPEEIENYATDNGLFLYEMVGGEILGCGVFKRIVVGRNDFDVGMVVAPAHRCKGIGSHIVRHLKYHCLNAGFRPVCGCNADNHASRRALEKAGFAVTHSLVEFAY